MGKRDEHDGVEWGGARRAGVGGRGALIQRCAQSQPISPNIPSHLKLRTVSSQVWRSQPATRTSPADTPPSSVGWLRQVTPEGSGGC